VAAENLVGRFSAAVVSGSTRVVILPSARKMVRAGSVKRQLEQQVPMAEPVGPTCRRTQAAAGNRMNRGLRRAALVLVAVGTTKEVGGRDLSEMIREERAPRLWCKPPRCGIATIAPVGNASRSCDGGVRGRAMYFATVV